MNWIIAHKDELQALSGLSVALLTLVLIVVTAIYVRANWKMMRLMEADVRLRTLPIMKFTLLLDKNDGRVQGFTANIQPTNIPVLLFELKIEFLGPYNARQTFQHFYHGDLLTPKKDRSIQGEIAPGVYNEWYALLDYTDLGTDQKYFSMFSHDWADEVPASTNRRHYEALMYEVIGLIAKDRESNKDTTQT